MSTGQRGKINYVYWYITGRGVERTDPSSKPSTLSFSAFSLALTSSIRLDSDAVDLGVACPGKISYVSKELAGVAPPCCF
jgi:hypothetical protein